MNRAAAGAILALVVGVCAVLGWQQMRIGQLRAAAAEQARQAERDALAREGALLAAETGQHEAERLAAGLRDQIDAIRRTAPDVRVVASGRVSTGKIVTRPLATPLGPSPEPGDESPPSPGSTSPADSQCVLAAGESAELGAEFAGLETGAGNHVLVGTLWAEARGSRILAGPIRADVSRWIVVPQVAPPKRPGWGLGVAIGAGPRGAWYGLAASPPPWRVRSLQAELVGQAGASASGAWQASVAGLVRW